MNCKQSTELLPEAALGGPMGDALREHLEGCPECARALAELRETLTLLDEWTAPEPSPYFDVHMQALLREEKQRQSWGRLHWLRRPVMGYAAAAALLFGVGFYSLENQHRTPAPTPAIAEKGTAVGDLQTLDQSSDLLATCDELSDSGDDNTSN